MQGTRDLHGSCTCGRYNYVVMVPENNAKRAQIYFATDGEHSKLLRYVGTAYE